ncbi:response regulator transcription factor [Pigmentiphaga soli]|uniref:Response regulator transcription factor n=1 Tax=Pigmentiphaga soli TaxID=1007095 RepID=A0ABP8GVG9_9BURK
MGKIVLMESHPLLRLGLWQILNKLDGTWEIVEMETSDVSSVDPSTVGVDFLIYGMPLDEESGWAPLADIDRRLRPKRILLLADGLPPPPLVQGLSSVPVYGYVMKSVSVEILEAAIRLVMAGGQCFPGSQVQQPPPDASGTTRSSSVATFPAPPGMAPGGSDMVRTAVMAEGAQLLHLTPRQYEVLVLLARGHPIKTISRMLNISVATAKTHACTLYQRLQVRNKGEAVYAALQRGATLEWHDAGAESPRVSSLSHKQARSGSASASG